MSSVKFPILCISFSLLCNFKDTLQWNECMGWAEGVCQVTKSSGHSVESNSTSEVEEGQWQRGPSKGQLPLHSSQLFTWN